MVALPLPVDREGFAVDGNGAGYRAGDLVSSGEVVVVGRSVRGPGQIHVKLGPGSGLPGVDIFGSVEDLRRRRRGDTELVKGTEQIELYTSRSVRYHQAVALGNREVVADRADAGPVGTHDPRRPPRHLAVRVETDPQPSPEGPVLMDEVGVVRLAPEILGADGVAALVVGGDDVGRRHDGEPDDSVVPEAFVGPWCMADAPGGPGTSVIGSSRSSNSVRRARDMTACWK